MTGMNREEAEKAFMEADGWKRISEKIKAEVVVEDVAKKFEEIDLSKLKKAAVSPKVNAPLQEISDAIPSPSANSPEKSKLATKGNSQPEGNFKEWIEKLEVRVQDLRKRREFLPQEILRVVDKYFASVLIQVKGLESWTESQIVNDSYQYHQELEAAIKEAQDVLQDLQQPQGEKEQEPMDSKQEVSSIQQEFLQLLKQKETARKKLLTRNRSKVCWNCHSTEDLLTCEACMKAKYCSEECQEEDREIHQDWCDQVKQRREERNKEKNNEKLDV